MHPEQGIRAQRNKKQDPQVPNRSERLLGPEDFFELGARLRKN